MNLKTGARLAWVCSSLRYCFHWDEALGTFWAQQTCRDTGKQWLEHCVQSVAGMDLSSLLDEVELNVEAVSPVSPWSQDSPGWGGDAVSKWWLALPHPSCRSYACLRMVAEQGQMEIYSQVLNALCYCLIDFKLCLLGNTPLRTCYIRLEMFFPNAALWLVNPLCTAESLRVCIWNWSCSSISLHHSQQWLSIPMAYAGMMVWHMLSSAVNHAV